MQMPLVHRLVYTWDGWPTGSSALPRQPDLSPVDLLWLKDGLRRLGCRWSRNPVQMSFEADPRISPVLFAARVKGRLDHLLRTLGTPACFSRKVGVRAIGDNTDPVVERYLSLQQVRGDLPTRDIGPRLGNSAGNFPDFTG